MNFSELLDNGWGILMVVLFFGGSIFIHELGHFLAAKWRGLHIERFSIGFGPKIVSWNRGGVEYRLSWLPLGGYVALPQLADMRGIEGDSSIDHQALPQISYADKVIVAVAGAVFNIIFAIVLATILFFTGRPSSAERASVEIGLVSQTLETIEGETVPAPAYVAGIKVGDFVREIDGAPIRNWENIQQAIALSSGLDQNGNRVIHFTVERDGQLLDIPVNPIISERNEIRQVGIDSAYDAYVNGVYTDSPAAKAGIQSGDIIRSVDSQPVRNRFLLGQYVQDKAGTPITLQMERDGQPYEATLTPVQKTITKDGETRVLTGIYTFVSAPDLIVQTPWEQIKDVFNMSLNTLRALLHSGSDIGVKQMSGPVEIGRVIFSLAQHDFLNTLWFVLVINVSLAVFNLMPIPVLDGGHIVFATINRLRSKPINPNFIASVQGSFMILLFSLMAYITYHNVARWGKDVAEANQREDNAIPITFSDDTQATQTD